MAKFIEYRVRPVTRYIVTRFWNEDGVVGGSSQHGEFDNHTTAYAVAYALCKQEHERLGWPLDDERIKYPEINPPGVEVMADPQDAIMAEAMEPQPLVKP